MAQKSAKPAKRKKKLTESELDAVRLLELAIANHERVRESATGELRVYFDTWIAKNRASLAELTGKV